MKFLFSVIALLLFSPAALTYQNAFAADDAVLANIGDKKITTADFERFISAYPPDKQKFLAENPQSKATLLKRIVEVTVLSDMARSKSLDKDPLVKEQIDYYANEILAQELLKIETSKIEPTEKDLMRFYSRNEDKFKVPEMVRARHILLKIGSNPSEEEKKRVREKAEGVLKRARSGEDFAKLATELSEDTGSKNKGGDLGFFQRGRMVKPFEETAFSLKPGEISGIVETQFGYHIIKVEEKKEAGIEPFDKVREKIKAAVVNEMRKEMTKNIVERAMKDAGAEIHPELLNPAK